MATDINASEPVTVTTASVTYDKWYLTKLIGDVNPEKALLMITLNRAGTVDGKTTLMQGKGSKVNFSLDAWKEMAETPEIGAAIQAVLTAVVAYATKKELL